MKFYLSVAILGLFLIFSSCNDDLNSIGGTIQPNEDGFEMFTDTFQIVASTIKVDSVYARTSSSLLGQLYDPLYGNLESDFLCQFYIQDNFKFSREPLNGVIDSMAFVMYYDTWVGDSITPMKASLYLVDHPLDKIRYTNINPKDYCSMTTLLGEKTYTARDMTVHDTIWYAKDKDTGLLTYSKNVTIPMSRELGQEIYDKSKNNSPEFQNQESFNKFFPGVYVTTSFGQGNILDIAGSRMIIYYQTRDTVKNNALDGDSIIFKTYREFFNTTKDVIQLNRIKNAGIDELVRDRDDYSFIKSPAGVFTRLVLPGKDMAKVLDGRHVNNMQITLKVTDQEKWNFALPAPTHLLIIAEDSLTNYFEENRFTPAGTNGIVSDDYSTSEGGQLRKFTFSNLSYLIKEHVKNSPDTDLRLLVIPVNAHIQTSSSNQAYVAAVESYLKPSGVKIRKDPEHMRVVITSSKFKK